MLKLAAVIFLFNQNGSRQRLVVLVLFVVLVYLYQTGVLTPIIRWLSQNMQRAAAPPRPTAPFEPRSKREHHVNAEIVIRRITKHDKTPKYNKSAKK